MNGNRLFIFFCAMLLILPGCASEPRAPEKVRIGFLNLTPTLEEIFISFKQAMTDQGYAENETIEYVYDGPLGRPDAADAAAEKLAGMDLDLIFTVTTFLAVKVKKALEKSANADTPVLFALVSDPVGVGLAESLRAPGGNFTGILSGSFATGGLEWMTRIIPDLKRMYVPFKTDDRSMIILIEDLKAEAEKRGIELVIAEAGTDAEVREALKEIPDDVQAVWEIASGYWGPWIDLFIQSAIDHRKPLMGGVVQWAESGALLSFGHSNAAMGRQAARLAQRILSGTSPGALPIERSEFFLHINLNTAEKLGVVIPEAVLKQADGLYH